MVRFRLSSLFAACALAVGLLVAGALPATAAGGAICSGGSIVGGTYKTLTVTGVCAIDSGNVTVLKDVVVTSTGGLDGTHSGSTLTVGHDLVVQSGGSAFLGCDPEESPCSNDATATTTDTIEGNLVSTGAMFLVIHDDVIGHDVRVSGGGTSYDCSFFAFTDFANDNIGHNVSINGLNTCWDGFANNVVGGSVDFDNNVAVIVEPDIGPDGNLLGGNVIGGNLNCVGNSPTPHLSDFLPGPPPNIVGGKTRGQCVGEV